MNKTLLIPIIGTFALSMLTSCGDKSSKEKVVEATLDEVIAMKHELDTHTKYHVTGVKPYSLHRGDGQSYPSDAYYFFAKGSDGTSYVSARVCTTKSIKHTEDGFAFNMDTLDVTYYVEKDLINQGADTNCVYDVNFFFVNFTSYRNVAVEILSYTPVVA